MSAVLALLFGNNRERPVCVLSRCPVRDSSSDFTDAGVYYRCRSVFFKNVSYSNYDYAVILYVEYRCMFCMRKHIWNNFVDLIFVVGLAVINQLLIFVARYSPSKLLSD